MKKVFAVVENWYNGPQYPEDQDGYTKIIGIANNLPDAYKLIVNRKISVLSYIDTKYDDCNETDKNTLKKLNGIYGRVKVMVK